MTSDSAKHVSTSPDRQGFDVDSYWQLIGTRQLAAAGIRQTEQQARRTVKGLVRWHAALQALPGVNLASLESPLQADRASIDQLGSEASVQFDAILMTCR